MDCPPDKAQAAIDSFYDTYKEVHDYVQFCKDCVVNPGYLDTPYGRRCRFSETDDEAQLAAMQREAVNRPIQGSVADLLSTARFNLWLMHGKCDFKLINYVHDSVVSEVAAEDVETYVDDVLIPSMCKGALVPAWKGACGRISKPFTLDADVEVTVRWGAKCTPEELMEKGMPEKAAKRFGRSKKKKVS